MVDTYWKEWVQVGNPPDLNRRSYFDLLSGSALENERAALEKKAALRESRRLPENSVFSHELLNVTVNDLTAVVIECVVDDAVVYETDTGAIVNKAVGTSTFETHLTKSDGHWTISDSFTIASRDGVQPCGD